MNGRGLIFYPHNFFAMNCGSHRRFHEIAEYLKARGVSADLISLDGFSNSWNPDSLKRGASYFDHIYVCKWRPTFRARLQIHVPFIRDRSLYNFSTRALRRTLSQALKANKYAFFFNSYVYWESLADDIDDRIVKIIDMHDFITLNHHFRYQRKEFRLGHILEQEINALNEYDYCVSISEEESLFLQPFCSHAKFIDLPMSFDARFSPQQHCQFDLVTVGSENLFNKAGMQWFMNEVYPLLPSTLSIAVVGGITNYVEKRPNIMLISFAENLDDIYRNARIAFCPVQSGTGLKVKVVEALSYGKPVVTTSPGLSGILQKENNGCIVADDPRRFAESVMNLITDQNVYNSVAAQARAFFLKKFTREACWPKLDSIVFQSASAQGTNTLP